MIKAFRATSHLTAFFYKNCYIIHFSIYKIRLYLTFLYQRACEKSSLWSSPLVQSHLPIPVLVCNLYWSCSGPVLSLPGFTIKRALRTIKTALSLSASSLREIEFFSTGILAVFRLIWVCSDYLAAPSLPQILFIYFCLLALPFLSSKSLLVGCEELLSRVLGWFPIIVPGTAPAPLHSVDGLPFIASIVNYVVDDVFGRLDLVVRLEMSRLFLSPSSSASL